MNNKKEAQERGKRVISNEELNATLHTLVKQHQEYYKSKHIKDFYPMVHAFNRANFNEPLEGAIYQVISNEFEGEGKAEIVRELGKKHYEETKEGKGGIVIAALSSEAWLSNDDKTIPSKDPLKKEVLVTSCLTLDYRSNMAVMEIKRDKDGIATLGEPIFFDYTESENITQKSNLLKNFFKGYSVAYVESKYDIPALGEVKTTMELLEKRLANTVKKEKIVN